MRLSKEDPVFEAHNAHAQTIAFIIWLAGAAVIYWLHDLAGGGRDKGTAEFIQTLILVPAFFYICALSPIQDRVLDHLLRKSRSKL